MHEPSGNNQPRLPSVYVGLTRQTATSQSSVRIRRSQDNTRDRGAKSHPPLHVPLLLFRAGRSWSVIFAISTSRLFALPFLLFVAMSQRHAFVAYNCTRRALSRSTAAMSFFPRLAHSPRILPRAANSFRRMAAEAHGIFGRSIYTRQTVSAPARRVPLASGQRTHPGVRGKKKKRKKKRKKEREKRKEEERERKDDSVPRRLR